MNIGRLSTLLLTGALASPTLAAAQPGEDARKTVEAIVWLVDGTGVAANAAFNRWPNEMQAVAEVAQLASGLPRPIELPGKKKALLLGECSAGQGKAVVAVLAAALPGVSVRPRPASDGPLTCPTLTRKSATRGVKIWKAGRNHVGLVASEQDLKAVAILRDRDGKLLDWKAFALTPSGQRLDACHVHVRLDADKDATVVATECSDSGQLRGRKCKDGQPDRYEYSARVATKGARLEVVESNRRTDGADCVGVR